MRKIVSMILVFVMTMLMLSSCNLITSINEMISGNSSQNNDEHNSEGVNGQYPKWDFYPKGYTAGFPDYVNLSGPRVEYWWVETYEECTSAMELLKSHGSTFVKTAIFTYDDELFDTKFLFKINNSNRFTEEIKFGDNPFDRKAGNVEVISYAFFNEVTIDEINHSDIKDYKATRIYSSVGSYKKSPTIGNDSVRWEWYDSTQSFHIYDENTNKEILRISSFGYCEDPEIASDRLRKVWDSLVFIGFDQ